MFKQTSNGISGSASHDALPHCSHRGSGISRIFLEFIFIATVACLAGPAWGQTGTSIQITRDGPDPSLARQGIVVFTHLDSDGGNPTGSITITDGTESCTATLPDTFCLYQPQTAGTKTLTANYSGDANFEPSTSPEVTHEVSPVEFPKRISIPDGYGAFGELVREANMTSNTGSVSDNGHYVTFASNADNLVPGDLNGTTDIFVHDLRSGSVVRITAGGDGASTNPAISADGEFVVFQSKAANLVSDDGNGVSDIFVHELGNGATTRVSVGASGAEANLSSERPSISRHGRFIAFDSAAFNLVPNDNNDSSDVFVFDRFNDDLDRVSVDSAVVEANGSSRFASISADGQAVAFQSTAPNLVPGDTNDFTDVFVHDRDTGDTVRASVANDRSGGDNFSSTGGTLANISSDGQRIVFESQAGNLVTGDNNRTRDIFVRDRDAGTTTRVSVGPGPVESNNLSENPAISADGSTVAFRSLADNLVAGDANGTWDIVVHNISTGTKEIASVTSAGRQTFDEGSTLPTLSSDGRFVAFETASAELNNNDSNGVTDIFLRDRDAQETLRASLAAAGAQSNQTTGQVSISTDGRFVAFASKADNLVSGDTNDDFDVFVLDRESGAVERISVSSAREQADGGSVFAYISGNGRFVTFVSEANNLVPGDTDHDDIFVHDRETGTTEQVSVAFDGAQGDGDSFDPAISADGSIVTFMSRAANLVDGDSNDADDVFIHDRGARTIERISVANNGSEANGPSYDVSISHDGQVIAFTSIADNLVDDDINGLRDIFVHDRTTGQIERVSVNSDDDPGSGGQHGARASSLSGNGRYVTFQADFSNLAANDTNGVDDIFVHDRDTGRTELVSVDDNGSPVDGWSIRPSISELGRFVAFASIEPDLDTDAETNEFIVDIFVHDRGTGDTMLMTTNRDGEATDAASGNVKISDSGLVGYQARATNLAPGDTNQQVDGFVSLHPILADIVFVDGVGGFE